MGRFHDSTSESLIGVTVWLRLLRRLRRRRKQNQQQRPMRARMRRAATIAPTMMPIVAPLPKPDLPAVAVLDGGIAAAAEVGVGVADDELDDEVGVSLAAADFTALAAAPAAPMKAWRGFAVAAAACADTLATLKRAIAAEKRICRCMVKL